MTVYTVTADMSGNMLQAVQKRDALGRAIARLAQKENEAVWFHDYTDPLGGAPVVMVECSEAFLAKIKALADVKQVSAVDSRFKTARHSGIQAYFTAVPKTPPARKPPQP